MKKKSFWLLALGAASSSVCGYGVAGWLPLFFMRSFGLTLTQVSWYYSGIALDRRPAGIWLGGMVADKLGKRVQGRLSAGAGHRLPDLGPLLHPGHELGLVDRAGHAGRRRQQRRGS
jgi:hypothetical protein